MQLSDATVETLKDLVRIQGMSGNWDYDEYMLGMYNGMELMLSIIENRESEFWSPPEKYLKYSEPPELMSEAVTNNE